MKRRFNYWLLGALVCGFCLGVASCKDDSNDGQSEEQQQAQASKALKFYEVVSHLADLSEMDDATYASQTFEPIIGEESQNDQLTRIVATNDMETAAARFANLTGAQVTASTASYTYSDPDVGTLTYTKSTDGTSWATVDVDIKQVPHLTKIVYCTPAQMGENGKFEGTAYYRFGDVVSREYTSKSGTKSTEYWICVRPAFGPEGKGDSHWISVGELPDDNIFHHSGSNGTEYYVPTKVCEDKENMQNFAEMLYAMFNPDQWWETLTTPGTTRPKIFWDFSLDSLNLHNKYFWKNVYEGWKEKGIAEKAFNVDNLEDLKTYVNQEGLNLLYSGYSWWTKLSWNCELYNISYTNGTGAEANFHKVKKETIKKNMKELRFDCRRMGQSLSNYSGFFGDNKHRWVVRYATGQQLMARGTFNKFEGLVGCTDVWNYNKKYGPTSNLSNTPPRPTPSPLEEVGCVIGADGNFYKDIATANQHTTAAAVVVYSGNAGSVESGKSYRGLAIALQDIKNQSWQNSADANHQCPVGLCRTDYGNAHQLLNGIEATKTLAQGCGYSHTHQAATACRAFNAINAQTRSNKSLSDWFIPSTGQWILALESVGLISSNHRDFTGNVSKLNQLLSPAGNDAELSLSTNYVTSTVPDESQHSLCIFVNVSNSGILSMDQSGRIRENYAVRPFIAF